ncbi:NADH-quinone oxidoreductase, subunit L [Vulcanisaeta moutnovskia 768-28]|uniref:NADH-quinone oxidoreductase, subunit L n=2 Tax=Vulcanisaeta TaxID=164450 RepID=F0QVB4_VULM7|nr:NADH-quinone oxidoreductase, subunit L [Vulcanisaeta moutnovskia 768-28]
MFETLLGELMGLMLLSPIVLAAPITIYWLFNQDPRKAKPLAYLAVIGLGVSAIIATYIEIAFPWMNIAYNMPWMIIPTPSGSFTIYVSFIVNFLSRNMGLLTAWLAFIIGVYSLDYLADDYRLGWFWFFYNLFAASMLLMVYANDLLFMFIGWEGLGFSSWALIGHWYKDDDELSYVGRFGERLILNKPAWTTPSYAAYRAIATIRFGDMPMLGAIAAIGILGGSLILTPVNGVSAINWPHVISVLGVGGTVALLLAFMLGPYTKSAQVPFNDWLLTAMTGPTSVSALLHSATMVAAGVYIFMRLTESLYMAGALTSAGVEIVYLTTVYIGLLTALLGALFATMIDERKVILAGSTMSSLGFMMGVTALTPFIPQTLTVGMYVVPLAVLVAFSYLIIHALAKATLFLVSGHLIHVTHTRFNMGDWEFGKRMKAAFYAALAAAISLGGVPPLAGYWIHAAMDEVATETVSVVGYGAYILMLLASLAYVAFLSRFVSLNFIKGERPHTHEEHGKYPLMVAAYIITGTAALASLAIPFVLQPAIFISAGVDPIVIAVGIVLWIIFIIALIKPRVGNLGLITRIFERRYYIQTFMDVVLAGFGLALTLAAFYIYKGFDILFNFLIPDAFNALSRYIRSIQRGYLRTYLEMLLVTLAIAILVILIIIALLM